MTFIWTALLGATLATKHKQHLGLDILGDKLPRPAAVLISVPVHLMMVTVALIFIVVGWDFVLRNATRISETTGVSMVYLYISGPVSGALMLFYLVEQLPELFAEVLAAFGRPARRSAGEVVR